MNGVIFERQPLVGLLSFTMQTHCYAKAHPDTPPPFPWWKAHPNRPATYYIRHWEPRFPHDTAASSRVGMGPLPRARMLGECLHPALTLNHL